ncbi:MAG TPA: hypothetical protein VEA19_05045 [Actinomycetota bacterium]|nr:hypothetical protein [Actinomycetota bacterium]
MKRRMTGTLVAAMLAATLVPLAATTASAVTVGNGEACTPGFWKNHTNDWQEYSTNTLVRNQFTALNDPAYSSLTNLTFLQALQGGGGDNLIGAARILLRAAVTAFLNAAHDELSYPLRRDATGFNGEDPIRSSVNDALASKDRDTILALASQLDAANNNGVCPLGGDNTNSG